MSRSALLSLNHMGGPGEVAARLTTAEPAGQYFVPWPAIDTWEVATDSDGPDFHRLRLRPRGRVHVRRFRALGGHEADLLDGVRAIGRAPVRLLDDLTAP
ncbi:MAG: hypothetical protein QM772_01255 [Ottowia sp.]|uniref:hypothetical protein n=1 Tax=Ottowia sp. TaxID=1898956 RepID=UPI0039E2BE16